MKAVGSPKFRMSYPKHIDRKNPYPKTYKIPTFALFARDETRSIIEQIAMFTIQHGTFVVETKFNNLRLRLFLVSLTGAVFAWYTALT